MKVLIYIGCFFVMVLIQVFFKNSGVILGGVPMVLLYLGTLAAAGGLCKLWDNRGQSK